MSEKKERALSCDVTRDLLPLYADEVCCQESKELVEEHLAGCEECRNELRMIKTEVFEQSAPMMEKTKFTMKRAMKKTRRKWMLSIVAVLAIMIGGFKMYLVSTDSVFVPARAYGSLMNVGNWARSKGFEKALLTYDFERVFDYFNIDCLYEEMSDDVIKDNKDREVKVSDVDKKEFKGLCKEKFLARCEEFVGDGGEVLDFTYMYGNRENGRNNIDLYIHYKGAQHAEEESYWFTLREVNGKFVYHESKFWSEERCKLDEAFNIRALLKE